MFNKLVEDNHLLHSKLVDVIKRHPLVCDFYELQPRLEFSLMKNPRNTEVAVLPMQIALDLYPNGG